MEFLPTSDHRMIKHIVELVPDKLYWASVDINLYSIYLKSNGVRSVEKPVMKTCVPLNLLSKSRESEAVCEGSENVDFNISPRKTKRMCVKNNLRINLPRIVYTDKVFVYRPLGKDFGPLDLPTTYRYIDFLDDLFLSVSVVLHVCDYRKSSLCSNSAYLASVYSVVRFGVTSAEIGSKLAAVSSILPYRDASMNPRNTFPLTIQDCCLAIVLSREHGWFDWDNFDVNAAEHYQDIDNGDLNWIFENKFLAFAGPSSDCLDEDGLDVHPPCHYLPIFEQFGITDIVRLNVSNYQGSEFEGINHHDLYFPDGSCPPKSVVDDFLRISQSTDSSVAVHCKAGLGRSACMIGIWAIAQYRITAHTFIAWARIARPGSVLGPQQHFLVEIQNSLCYGGNGSRKSNSRILCSQGSASPMGVHGDRGQGSRLLKQKRQQTRIPRTLPFA